MKKLLFLFILITSLSKAQNDSIVVFLFSDDNNNGIFESGMGEKPIINYCLSIQYKHTVSGQDVWSYGGSRSDINGRCAFRYLGTLSAPDSNIISAAVAFPSDIIYNGAHFSIIRNLPKTGVTQIPLYSVFGFKNEKLSYIGVGNSPGMSGSYQQYCLGSSVMLITTSGYCRNYVDINPGVIPFTYTITNGVTTNVYNDMVTINWPSTGMPSCGAGGGAYYLNPIPELNAVGAYTLTYANAISFSNMGYNDGYPYTESLQFIVDSCSKVTGVNTYVECSNDCYKGGGEYFSSDEVITSTNGTYTTMAIPDYNGNYNVLSPYSATAYTLTALPNAGFSHTCSSVPTSTYISASWTSNIVRYDQLAQTSTSNVNCYSFINTPVGLTVPGSVFHIQPFYGISHPNYCSVLNHTGKFWVKLSSDVSFQSLSASTPSYTTKYPTASGDSIVWNISDLRQYANNMNGSFFSLNILMKTTATVGNNYCFKSGVISLYPETSFTDNESSNCWVIGGPFDPNYKEVSPKGTGPQGYISTSTNELLYTINFQNVGNSPAVNVKVNDLLDSNVDKTSLKIIGSSAPVQTNIDGTGLVTFLFDNIILPDSTHDEPHSHGFVTYKINLKPSLVAGTQIHNSAAIYFDYNAAVLTNTVLNTLQTVTEVQELHSGSFEVYPNPSNGIVTVNSSNVISKITIINVLGEVVKSITVDSKQVIVDLTDLKSNVYFLQITDAKNQTSIKKIVKE